MQIDTDYCRIPFVPLGQHLQITDPSAFRILVGVPERGLSAGIRAVAIEEDAKPDLAAISYDLIHNLQTAQSLQVRIPVEIDPVRCDARIKHLIAEGKPKRVVTETFDLIEHVSIIAGP